MSEFIGTLKNKTTGQTQNVTDRDPDMEECNDYTVRVEGDTRWHVFGKKEYDFIPPRKTFQEQFSDLKIGDVFTVEGFNGYRVKVSANHYYSSNYPELLADAKNIVGFFEITKSDD